MSIPGLLNRVDVQRALVIERLILEQLKQTVGWDHPAIQATVERVGALRVLADCSNTS